MVDIEEIKKLSVEERILMVEEIWDSIAEDTIYKSTNPIQEEEKMEMLRRLQEFKSGNKKTYTWEEVKMYAKEP
ncbi:MAG: addiction module protein [Bacteroidetes bacterium]|nr:addiction module protein [Bacteroidota bacterium]MBS1540253.1 addiction module protein [Bacteroidota bacterium]